MFQNLIKPETKEQEKFEWKTKEEFVQLFQKFSKRGMCLVSFNDPKEEWLGQTEEKRLADLRDILCKDPPDYVMDPFDAVCEALPNTNIINVYFDEIDHTIYLYIECDSGDSDELKRRVESHLRQHHTILSRFMVRVIVIRWVTNFQY